MPNSVKTKCFKDGRLRHNKCQCSQFLQEKVVQATSMMRTITPKEGPQTLHTPTIRAGHAIDLIQEGKPMYISNFDYLFSFYFLSNFDNETFYSHLPGSIVVLRLVRGLLREKE